jgi:hypothetical protein
VCSARAECHNPSLALIAATCTTLHTYDGAGTAVTRSIHAVRRDGTLGWKREPRGELGFEGSWLALRGGARTPQRTRVR